MPRYIKYIFLVLCLQIGCNVAYAGRPPGPFLFELISESTLYEQGAVMEFTLRITNWDDLNTHPVLLPGPGYQGRKFIYLTAHADDQYKTPLAVEDNTGLADSTGVYNYQLAPGEHLDIRLKVYPDARLAVIPSEPHWFSRPLDTGAYQLQAWYLPYEDLELTGRAHQGIEDHSQYNGATDFFRIELMPASQQVYNKLDECKEDCGFCRDIERGRWKKVKKAIEARVKISYEAEDKPGTRTASRGYWLDRHRNIAYVSPLPEAVPAIFPGHSGHVLGFKSGDSVLYYNMTVQSGRLFPGRARLQSIAYWMFRRNGLFKTSDEDYVGLSRFEPVPAPNLFPFSSR